MNWFNKISKINNPEQYKKYNKIDHQLLCCGKEETRRKGDPYKSSKAKLDGKHPQSCELPIARDGN